MFDVGASELLMIAVVAIVVIGPKDLPLALRTAGRWVAKIRRVSGHFRSGIETMIREAEMEELERKWRDQNEQIMAAHPDAGADGVPGGAAPAAASAEARQADMPPAASAETRIQPEAKTPANVEPQLPLGGPVSRHEP